MAQASVAAEVTRDISDGAIKLWATSRVLRLRREEHALFRSGSYLPLYASGAAGRARDRVCTAA